MLKHIFAILALLLLPSVASADDFDLLIGEWESPDGYAKMSWERRFDGSLIESKTWFRAGDGWHLVGLGAAYTRPGEIGWYVNTRTRDMDGIELFQSTILPGEAPISFRVTNVAYLSDGTTIDTEEEWVFSGSDKLSYTIYRQVDGQRSAWMKGSWVRISEVD